jgi:hypothetical protein
MPPVLPLVPGKRSTPEAVVVKEVRRYALVVAISVLTTKRRSQRLRRVLVVWLKVGWVAKRFEFIVVDNANARDPMAARVVCNSCRCYQI